MEKWYELPEAGLIIEPGSAAKYKTGSWRSRRPIWDKDTCTSCLTCWIYCPDSSILVENHKVKGINFDYCKGCGICAKICPPKVSAIRMEEERK
ncbi:4Fe-4S binding protein [bacterium]|nr:4Fe-4S binding protein [bacterium]MBU1599006.1 4Fe-4S binding protein [bacterium]